ncbi:hypothetical protein JCM3774_001528 [Rhodotorula dairenensis]
MGDPFPLFHLCDLDFAVSAELIPRLPAYQLALAPWSTAWSDDLEPALKRTWRRKRERVRTQITQGVPCGVFATAEERQKEQFPKFELIPLDFDLGTGEAGLDSLTSAQLAAIQFHPNGSKALAFAAEDIFFSRRERDFAAGLALPPFVPAAAAAAPAPAPAPVAAPAPPVTAPVPAPVSAPVPAPVSVPAAVASAPPPPLASVTQTVPLQSEPSPRTSAEHAPRAPVAPTHAHADPQQPPPSVPSPVQSASTVPAAAASSAPTTALAPLSPGTRQRQLERAEYRRSVNGHRDSSDRAASSSHLPQRNGDRTRSRSRERDRPRDRDLEKEKERQRERDRDAGRERERERERGSRSRRSSRERTTTTRDKERYRRSSRSRDRERDRNHDRDRDRDRDRHRDRSLSPTRRSSQRARSRSRSVDRSDLVRRLADEKRLSVAASSPPRGLKAEGTTGAAHRKRASNVAPSDVSLRDYSVRRKLQHDVDFDSARRSPPPQMPLPGDDIPRELHATLKTVFMRHFPGKLTPGDVEAWLRTLSPVHSTMPITPIGIKTSHRRNSDQSPNQDPSVTLAFVAFRTEAEAAEVQARADKQSFGNRILVASWSREVGKKSAWKWSDFTPEFVEDEYSRALAEYAARASGVGGGPARGPGYAFSPADSAPPVSRMAAASVVPAPHSLPASSSAVAYPQHAQLPRAAPPGTSTNAAELPTALVTRLCCLYVCNLPRAITLRECRDFFDHFDNLVGLALEPPVSESELASAWLAFENELARSYAKHAMFSLKYPGTYKKLWVENAEDRARNHGEWHVWTWGNMSKNYKDQHAVEFERVRASLPDSPTLSRNGLGLPPAATRLAPVAHGTFVPSVAYTRAAHLDSVYSAGSRPSPINGAPASQNSPYMAAAAEAQTYSPMQPFLASFPPPPAPYASASYMNPQPSPHVAYPLTQAGGSSSANLAGGHINPARLAMLQASLTAAGYTTTGTVEASTDPRPAAATDRLQADEAARNAWAGARRCSGSAALGDTGPDQSSTSTGINVKGITASQSGEGSPARASPAPAPSVNGASVARPVQSSTPSAATDQAPEQTSIGNAQAALEAAVEDPQQTASFRDFAPPKLSAATAGTATTQEEPRPAV